VASNRNALYLVERNLILPAIVKLSRARTFVVGDVLRDFELAAVLQICGDAGRAESVVSGRSGRPAKAARSRYASQRF